MPDYVRYIVPQFALTNIAKSALDPG
jgi:phosphoribulokinase